MSPATSIRNQENAPTEIFLQASLMEACSQRVPFSQMTLVVKSAKRLPSTNAQEKLEDDLQWAVVTQGGDENVTQSSLQAIAGYREGLV